jgi:sigma-B regulation protein RsbU (phosphoserine phosphatase)
MLAVLGPLVRTRRAVDRVEEQNQQLAQDRQRLLDFMHRMAEAPGEGLGAEALRQRIVPASILCSGALSACMFERTERNTLRGVVVEGLFPPPRRLADAAPGGLATRARFIEQVLKTEEFPVGEGMVGVSRRPGGASCWRTRRRIRRW